MLSVREVFYLSGNQKCQSCDNIFPIEFADRCLGWHGGDEEYTEYELIVIIIVNAKIRKDFITELFILNLYLIKQ